MIDVFLENKRGVSLKMQDYGIKVSLPGYDVLTIPNSAENIKKFALLSGINLLKIKSAVKVSIANGAISTIPHGLVYIPIVWVFLEDASNHLVPVYYNINSTYMYVDATNLVIRNSTGATEYFYYYIFYDPV